MQAIRAGTRPPRDQFIRVHPFESQHGKEEWCLNVLLFEFQFDGALSPESFLVPHGTDVYNELSSKLKPALIVLGITRGDSRFLWELKMPDPGSARRSNAWAETRLECAIAATQKWLKPVADIESGCYHYDAPEADLADPDFGSETFERLVELAYAQRIINTLDHEVVREFKGA